MGTLRPGVRLLAGPAPVVAPRLLGSLVRTAGPAPVVVRVTEVEAYAGVGEDPASHAHRGVTPRCASMAGSPGLLYAYLSHGVHVCLNVVTGPAGVAGAVLLRAGEVVEGLPQARVRRPGVGDDQLARGPGCLGRVLGAERGWDGADLLAPAGSTPLTLQLPRGRSAPHAAGPRTGVRGAPDRAWRFWLPGERSVSTHRRARTAVPEEQP